MSEVADNSENLVIKSLTLLLLLLLLLQLEEGLDDDGDFILRLFLVGDATVRVGGAIAFFQDFCARFVYAFG